MNLINAFINLSKEIVQKGVMGISLIEIGYLLIFVITASTFYGFFAKFVLKNIIEVNKVCFVFPSISIYLEKNDLIDSFFKNISGHNKS